MGNRTVCVKCANVVKTREHARRPRPRGPDGRPPPPLPMVIGSAYACSVNTATVGADSPVTADSRRSLPVLCEDINAGSCRDYRPRSAHEAGGSLLPLAIVGLVALLVIIALASASAPSPPGMDPATPGSSRP